MDSVLEMLRTYWDHSEKVRRESSLGSAMRLMPYLSNHMQDPSFHDCLGPCMYARTNLKKEKAVYLPMIILYLRDGLIMSE